MNQTAAAYHPLKMQIPDQAVHLILLQRTQYLLLPRLRPLWCMRRFVPRLTLNNTAAWEAKVRRQQIKRLYAADMRKEYEIIEHFLPNRSQALLDVGCGLAGIDVYLFNHFRPQESDVFLLDKTQVDQRIHHGFEQTGSFYNSLLLAQSLLELNGIPAQRIHLLEATDDNRIKVRANFGLILSMLSWGFHYPVGTYLEPVYDLLLPGGRLIIDVRKGTEGESLLGRKFTHLEVISEGSKSRRVLAIK